MKEIVTANGIMYECINVSTGLDSISLLMENQNADDLEVFFREVTELTVSMEGEEEPHGVYKDLKFESITKYLDGTVSVTMHIKDEMEKRLEKIEADQILQNGAIEELAEIIGG